MAVSRRLEIELTSRRSDGTWTWRVAGARLPKGIVDGDLVPGEAVVGAVLRAEAEASLDGLSITRLSMPRERTEPEGRLELVNRSHEGLITARSSREPSQAAQHSERSEHRDLAHRPRRGAPRRSRGKQQRHGSGDLTSTEQRHADARGARSTNLNSMPATDDLDRGTAASVNATEAEVVSLAPATSPARNERNNDETSGLSVNDRERKMIVRLGIDHHA